MNDDGRVIRLRELAASPSVLISENYWRRRFSGDPSVLGKSIRLNGAAFTIIGIAPHNFIGTSVAAPDFWLPLSLYPLVHSKSNRLRDREDLVGSRNSCGSPVVILEKAAEALSALD